MMDKLLPVVARVVSAFEDLQQSMRAVPFGNSAFQNEHLADPNLTPHRRLRFVLLQLSQRVNTLQGCAFRRRRLALDLEEAQAAAARAEPGLARQRIELDIEEKTWALKQEVKLINDALIECETFYAIFANLKAQLPELTRASFERAELPYWRERLSGDARRELLAVGTVSAGTLEALEQCGLRAQRDAAGALAITSDEEQERLPS